MNDIKIAFFDLDGTLSVPEYRNDGEPVIGFPTISEWVHYCETAGQDAYQYCKPVMVTKKYAAELKSAGIKLYVLTAVMSDAEIKAKNVFIKNNYDGFFEELLTVSNASEKREKIRKTAEMEGVPCCECELVEDDFSTLLDVICDGVKTTHISQLIDYYIQIIFTIRDYKFICM